MGKPWDGMRVVTKTPIGTGKWVTSDRHASVNLVGFLDRDPKLAIGNDNSWQVFSPADLRQLAEFCYELADQVEDD